MAGKGDDAAVRVISRLTVDTSLAIQNIRQLAKETGTSQKEIRRLLREVQQSWKELDNAKLSDGQRAREEERMWARLAKQKEIQGKAEEAQMRREIAHFERYEKVRELATERQAAVQRRNAAEAEKAAAVEAKRAQREVEAQAKIAAQEAKRLSLVRVRMEKERATAANNMPNMVAQAASMQMRAKMEQIVDLNLKSQLSTHRKKVEELEKEVGLTGKLTDRQMLQYRQLQDQAHFLNTTMTRVAADQHRGFGGSLANMMGRRAEWFMAGQIFFGVQEGLRRTVNDVADVEKRMVQLARVMEDPAFQIDQMRDSIFALSQEFGFTFQETQDIVLRWAQAGYSVNESLEATRASLMALNTAELDAEQSTRGLIGVLAQWGMGTDQLQYRLDQLNKVSDDYTIETKELIDGLLRSSSAANNANMTFEQTVAILTAMQKASGRTGKEVGNAMNSIFSYIQRAKSLETMQEAGIAVFADAEGKKLRSTFDLLTDLAARWNDMGGELQRSFMDEAEVAGLFSEEVAEATGTLEEWSDVQRRDIMQSAAGVYRRNYMLSLLKNFAQVNQVLITQEQALGYSRRENERTMSTAVKQVAALKAELQQAGYAIAGESGLLPALKTLVQTLARGADAFNKLPEGFKQVVIWTGLIGSAMGLANLTARQFFGATLMEGVKAARWVLRGLSYDITRMVAGMGGIGPALMKLTPLALALAGTIAYVQSVNKEAYRLQDGLAALTDTMESAIKSEEAQAKIHSQNAEAVRKLSDEYRALNKQKGLRSLMGEDDPQDVAVRQRQILNDLEQMLDDESVARLRAADFAKEASDQVIAAEEAKAKAAREAMDKHTKAYRDGVRDLIDTTLKQIEMLEAQRDGWRSTMTASERMTVLWGQGVTKVHSAIANSLVWLFGIAKDVYGWLADQLQAFADKAKSFDGADFIPGVKQAREWAGGLADVLAYGSGKMASASAKLQENADAIATNFLKAIGTGVSGGNVGWANAFLDPSKVEERAKSAIGDAKTRLQKLLIDLQRKADELSPDGKPPGEVVPGSPGPAKGDVPSIVDGIVAETEAIGKLNDETERQVKLLQERIAYNTREGATMAELLKADGDRNLLQGYLIAQQMKLHEQAEAARTAYTALAEAQGKVDRSTEDGAKAYDELGRAMDRMLGISGDASAKWWQLERQKADLMRASNAVSTETIRVLGELRAQYENGVLPLDEYVRALERLEAQTGLTKEAAKQLNEEQAKAFKQQWTSQIAEALKNEKAEIEGSIKAIEDVLKRFEEMGQDGRGGARSAAQKALQSLLGTTPDATMPSVADLSAFAQEVLDKFATMDFGELSPQAFADLLSSDLSALQSFSTQAQGYLQGIGDATAQRLGEIADEMKQVDEWLKGRLAELQKELDALDEQDKEDERQKTTDQHNERLQRLQDQLTWAMASGADQYELAAINAQIAEEEKRWAEQLADWEKQDARAAIQKKMDDAREIAEKRKAALEAEREELQAQQAAMQELMTTILTYIASEIEARKKALEGEKGELDQTSKDLDETMKGVEGGVLDTLSFMASQNPEYFKKAKGLIQSLIDGMKDRKTDLQKIIDEIKQMVGSVGGTVLPDNPPPSGPPAGQGNFTPMAEGAYVRGGRGGVLALIGERRHDEVVWPVPKISPIITQSLRQAMASMPLVGGLGNMAGEVARAVQGALANAAFYGHIDVVLPDGTIQKQVVKVFSGFGQTVRG